jgi:hypothetical protein
MVNKWQILFGYQTNFNFDNSQSLSDDKYELFTSLTKFQFGDLPWDIYPNPIFVIIGTDSSELRLITILLYKLRLGLLNTLLVVLFQSPNKRAVSRSLESVLGFNHITCHEVIHQHNSTIVPPLMCANEPDRAIFVMDVRSIDIQGEIFHYF